jgi:spore coat polysaccharide biosynthesis protein SpsF
MGHIVRCITLAEELKDDYGCEVVFAIRQSDVANEMIQKKGFLTEKSDENTPDFTYSSWLIPIVEQYRPNVFIMDVRDDLPDSVIQDIRKRGILIITIDDPSNRRLLADLAFYPPIPQVKKMDWSNFKGKLFAGWEWILLRPEFSIKNKRDPHTVPVILVTMGGSDPFGLTMIAVSALELLEEKFEVHLIVGPAFTHNKELQNLMKKTRHHYRILENVSNMADIMREADLAVHSFGVTSYELAALGIPSICLCLTDDHAESASLFVDEGMLVSLGTYQTVTTDELARAIRNLISDPMQRKRMSEISRQKVDGLGVKRIAETIIKGVS